jgi:hypothetical protein
MRCGSVQIARLRREKGEKEQERAMMLRRRCVRRLGWVGEAPHGMVDSSAD